MRLSSQFSAVGRVDTFFCQRPRQFGRTICAVTSTQSDPSSEIYAQIDREAVDEDERRVSRMLVDVLRQRRGELGGVATLPADDRALSERIQSAAADRSREIRSAGGSARSSVLAGLDRGRPVPPWLIIAWILVALAAATAFWWLW